MVSSENFSGDRWRRGSSGMRWRIGSGFGADSLSERRFYGEDFTAGRRGLRRGPVGGSGAAAISARKLAAALWRAGGATTCGGAARRRYGLFDRLRIEFGWSELIPRLGMEGSITEWDYGCFKASGDVNGQFYKHAKVTENQVTSESFKLAEREKQQCRTIIKRYCYKKLDEEKAAWKTKQHHKTIMSTKLKVIKSERDDTEILNLKLRNFMEKSLEKEKRVRRLLEATLDDLVKEREANKVEIEALRDQHARVQEQVENERKMLHITDVLRDEHAQTKLLEARLIWEAKYCQINNLMANLEEFLKSHPKIKDSQTSGNISTDRQAYHYYNVSSCKSQQKKSSHFQEWRHRPLSRNPHIIRAMRGHIQWPRQNFTAHVAKET